MDYNKVGKDKAPSYEGQQGRGHDVKTSKTMVTTCSVNVREHPNITANILGVAEFGERIEVIENLGEWSIISYSGRDAHIMSEFLSDEV